MYPVTSGAICLYAYRVLDGYHGAGVVLFVFGTGPIKGFAITLCIGILTTLFTALLGSRALINLLYGHRRKLDHLPI